jgi:hypothetical protein
MTSRRRAGNLLLTVLLLLFIARPLSAALPSENLLRIHGLGLKQVGTDTNAAQLMKVWQLPQTAALVAQTLDKISRIPGHGTTNTASALLRPLLDDLITSEFYLEMDFATNPQSAIGNSQSSILNPQLLLAVRLHAYRARLWWSNLAAASAALADSGTPHRIECSRTGDWTLVGVGLDEPIAKTDFAAHLPRHSVSATNHDWLQADFTPSCLAALDPQLSSLITRHSSLSHLHLALSGDAGNVHTAVTLDFSRPLTAPLPPWEIPTNLIHAPLDSFAAVRGISAWLTDMSAWQKLQFTPAPGQAYLWAQSGGPYLTWFAAPLPGASNQLAQLSRRLVQKVNPWLVTNADGFFNWQTNPPGIVWHLFIIAPFLESVPVHHTDWLLGGLFPVPEDNTNPPPAEFLRAVLGDPDLVYYQGEHTGQRMADNFFVSQLFRAIFQKAALPPAATAALWLKNAAPLLGDSATSVTRTGPQQLTLARNSTLGFTALELNLLADWFESPQFPRGLHTFLAPPGK